MTRPPDQNPTRRNRRRPNERGLARFEILGRESDRELIRTLVRRLAGGRSARRPSAHHRKQRDERRTAIQG